MSALSRSRIVTAACLAVALGGALAGCGGSEIDPDAAAVSPTTEPVPTTPAPAPAPTSTQTVSTPKPKPTPTPDEGGDGDAAGDDSPATAGGGVCRYLGADEVGDVLGVQVSGRAVPGETGCKFDQGGKRGMSVTILDKPASEVGGMAGARAEATSAVEGEPENLPGVGSAAFVVTGSMFGGTDVQAAGSVQVGKRIISVFLVQRSAIAPAKVRTLEVDLLKLVATAVG